MSISFISKCIIFQSIVRGLTKYVKFDHEGHRKEFELNVIELGLSGLYKVGTWNNTHRLKIERPNTPSTPSNDGSMRNVSLRVLTAIVNKILFDLNIVS